MTAPAAPAAVAFPGEVFAVTNIPIRVPTHFIGRDDALADIETPQQVSTKPVNSAGDLPANPSRSNVRPSAR